MTIQEHNLTNNIKAPNPKIYSMYIARKTVWPIDANWVTEQIDGINGKINYSPNVLIAQGFIQHFAWKYYL